MLVLTRKRDESIVINGNIVVTIVGVINGQVRVGISAPRDIPIYRGEIQEVIDRGEGRGSNGGEER